MHDEAERSRRQVGQPPAEAPSDADQRGHPFDRWSRRVNQASRVIRGEAAAAPPASRGHWPQTAAERAEQALLRDEQARQRDRAAEERERAAARGDRAAEE